MDPQAELMDVLASGLAHCHVVISDEGGLLSSLALAGLAGGFTHCAGMCGPFVLAQVTARLEAIPADRMREVHRLTGAALVPYHLGRTTTYAMLGAALAGLAGAINRSGLLDWISAALLLVAALLFIGYALPRLRVGVPGGAKAEAWWSDHVGRLARPLMREPVGWRGYGLGVMLGFIPCGLLYGALAAAASSGEVLTGALAMAVFGLATVPSLLVVGVAGGVAATRFRGAMAVAVPALMLLNAGVLLYLAVMLVI
jgi:sulfite exporter TauE/SafE